MKALAIAMFAAVLASNAGACEVEDWRWRYIKMFRWVIVEGVTTCASGVITLRAYEGNGTERKFLGVGTDDFFGFAFIVTVHDVRTPPLILRFDYAINKPRPSSGRP